MMEKLETSKHLKLAGRYNELQEQVRINKEKHLEKARLIAEVEESDGMVEDLLIEVVDTALQGCAIIHGGDNNLFRPGQVISVRRGAVDGHFTAVVEGKELYKEAKIASVPGCDFRTGVGNNERRLVFAIHDGELRFDGVDFEFCDRGIFNEEEKRALDFARHIKDRRKDWLADFRDGFAPVAFTKDGEVAVGSIKAYDNATGLFTVVEDNGDGVAVEKAGADLLRVVVPARCFSIDTPRP